jgi:hypothetical protein
MRKPEKQKLFVYADYQITGRIAMGPMRLQILNPSWNLLTKARRSISVAAKSPATVRIVMGLTNPKFVACNATLALFLSIM